MNDNQIQNKAITALPNKTIEKAVFMHDCCASCYKFFLQFKKDHPDVEIETFNILHTFHNNLHIKYNFPISDLKTHCYLYYNNQLIKGLN